MFHSLENASGPILFENDSFMLLKIEDSQAKTMEANKLRKLLPACSHINNVSSRIARFPHILMVQKNAYEHTVLTNKEVNEIDEESIVNGNSDLQKLVLSIKTIKGRNESVDVDKLFTAHLYFNKESKKLTTPRITINDLHMDISSNKFHITVPPTGYEAQTLLFMNEFETIYVPVRHSNLELILDKLKNRSKLNGRISSDYRVHPSSYSCDGPVFIRQLGLRNMKTDELLSFFGHPKKAGSKVETLSGCLQAVSKRYLKDCESELDSEQISFVEVQTERRDIPIYVPPLDYVLCRASHYEIVHAETKNNKQNLFVRMCKETRDDMAQIIFTTWEQNKRNIQIGLVEPQDLHNVFALMRNSI